MREFRLKAEKYHPRDLLSSGKERYGAQSQYKVLLVLPGGVSLVQKLKTKATKVERGAGIDGKSARGAHQCSTWAKKFEKEVGFSRLPGTRTKKSEPGLRGEGHSTARRAEVPAGKNTQQKKRKTKENHIKVNSGCWEGAKPKRGEKEGGLMVQV